MEDYLLFIRVKGQGWAFYSDHNSRDGAKEVGNKLMEKLPDIIEVYGIKTAEEIMQ